MRAPRWRSDLAAFLLVRGPYAWIGHGWFGCATWDEPVGGPGQVYERPAALDDDYGAPTQLCRQSSPGVFSRRFTRANVSYDCNTGATRIVTARGNQY